MLRIALSGSASGRPGLWSPELCAHDRPFSAPPSHGALWRRSTFSSPVFRGGFQGTLKLIGVGRIQLPEWGPCSASPRRSFHAFSGRYPFRLLGFVPFYIGLVEPKTVSPAIADLALPVRTAWRRGAYRSRADVPNALRAPGAGGKPIGHILNASMSGVSNLPSSSATPPARMLASSISRRSRAGARRPSSSPGTRPAHRRQHRQAAAAARTEMKRECALFQSR
jgi:hypothetical protein